MNRRDLLKGIGVAGLTALTPAETKKVEKTQILVKEQPEVAIGTAMYFSATSNMGSTAFVTKIRK